MPMEHQLIPLSSWLLFSEQFQPTHPQHSSLFRIGTVTPTICDVSLMLCSCPASNQMSPVSSTTSELLLPEQFRNVTACRSFDAITPTICDGSSGAFSSCPASSKVSTSVPVYCCRSQTVISLAVFQLHQRRISSDFHQDSFHCFSASTTTFSTITSLFLVSSSGHHSAALPTTITVISRTQSSPGSHSLSFRILLHCY